MQAAAAITCLILALVCGYIFLANFEYSGVTPGKVIFGSLATMFLLAAVSIAAKKRGRP